MESINSQSWKISESKLKKENNAPIRNPANYSKPDMMLNSNIPKNKPLKSDSMPQDAVLEPLMEISIVIEIS